MINTNNKKIGAFFGSLMVVSAVFGGGYYLGENNSNTIEASAKVENREKSVETDADFAAFWNAWNTLNEKYVSSKKTPTDQDKVWGAIQGLTASYNDPYTVFFPPEESKAFDEDISGEFQGVGMEIGINDKLLTVVSPLKNSPAEKAGIRAGDRILKIDDVLSGDMPVDKAVKMIRGKKGTTVTLTLSRSGVNEPIVISIVRDVISVPIIETEKGQNGVFIIKLYSFSASSPDLFRTALREFVTSNSDKLILDLRGNPGGYLEASVDMASWFLPAGKVVVKEDFGNNESETVYRSKGYNIFNDNLKMAILVNKGSASASEILAGALSEHKVAKLVGEQTFGKGSVQELVKITPDTSLKITVARWLTPNGLSISEGGLAPDVKVSMTKEDFENKKDPQMEKAVELLTSGQ